jgi:hypothetical protein
MLKKESSVASSAAREFLRQLERDGGKVAFDDDEFEDFLDRATGERGPKLADLVLELEKNSSDNLEDTHSSELDSISNSSKQSASENSMSVDESDESTISNKLPKTNSKREPWFSEFIPPNSKFLVCLCPIIYLSSSL